MKNRIIMIGALLVILVGFPLAFADFKDADSITVRLNETSAELKMYSTDLDLYDSFNPPQGQINVTLFNVSGEFLGETINTDALLSVNPTTGPDIIDKVNLRPNHFCIDITIYQPLQITFPSDFCSDGTGNNNIVNLLGINITNVVSDMMTLARDTRNIEHNTSETSWQYDWGADNLDTLISENENNFVGVTDFLGGTIDNIPLDLLGLSGSVDARFLNSTFRFNEGNYSAKFLFDGKVVPMDIEVISGTLQTSQLELPKETPENEIDIPNATELDVPNETVLQERNITVTIPGINNFTNITGTHTLNITHEGEELLRIQHNFSDQPLNITDLVILENESEAWIIIQGIEVNKTIVTQSRTGSGNICVLDQQVNNITEMSDGCDGANETLISCDGTVTNGYQCTDDGGIYTISGLQHTAIREQAPSAPTPAPSNSGGGGSSGGGSFSYTTRATNQTETNYTGPCRSYHDCKAGYYCDDSNIMVDNTCKPVGALEPAVVEPKKQAPKKPVTREEPAPIVDEQQPEPKRPSRLKNVLIFIALTALAIGIIAMIKKYPKERKRKNFLFGITITGFLIVALKVLLMQSMGLTFFALPGTDHLLMAAGSGLNIFGMTMMHVTRRK